MKPAFWHEDGAVNDVVESSGEAKPAVDKTDEFKRGFRDAMARLGAAVNIITTDGPCGRAGFAATAVCSLSDSSPAMIVCLNRASSAYRPVTGNGVLCINILGEGHQEISRLFGGKTSIEDRFAAGQWTVMPTGTLALDGAITSLDCKIKTAYDGITHDILVCEVHDIISGPSQQALIYLNRSYKSL